MYCQNCGKQLPKKAAFCPGCGTALPNGKKKKKKKSKLLLVVLIAVIVILLALIGSCSSGVRLQKLDKAQAQKLIDHTLYSFFSEADPDNYILQVLSKEVSAQVESVKKTDTGYAVVCTFNSLDMENCIRDYLSRLDPTAVDSYTNVRAALEAEIADANPMQESFTVTFTPTAGTYAPVFSEDVINFCSGNLPLLLPDIYAILGGDGQ